MLSLMSGSWVRYKADDEEKEMKYIGCQEMYEETKGVIPKMIITIPSENTFVEKLIWGDWVEEFVMNIGGESEVSLHDGAKVKVFPKYETKDKMSASHECVHNGIHQKYIRKIVGDEIHDIHEYDHGKCVSIHCYKRS